MTVKGIDRACVVQIIYYMLFSAFASSISIAELTVGRFNVMLQSQVSYSQVRGLYTSIQCGFCGFDRVRFVSTVWDNQS